MGIQGLLTFLHAATRPVRVQDEFAGCVLAVDVYSWIHRGSYFCAEKLVLEQPTNAYALLFFFLLINI